MKTKIQITFKSIKELTQRIHKYSDIMIYDFYYIFGNSLKYDTYVATKNSLSLKIIAEKEER